MKIVVSGGGTGGHIYPAVTIARAAEQKLAASGKSCELLYIGTSEGLEAKIIPREGFAFKTIHASGISRSFSAKNIKTLVKTSIGVFQAIAILRSFKPDLVIGTGGFVCGPVLLAAAILGVPVVIQEQNALPGVTNKLLARFAAKICLGYREAAQYFPASCAKKVVYTGNPVRSDIMSADRTRSFSELGLREGRTTVLVVGGSRGAKSINTAVADSYEYFAANKEMQLLHVTGDGDFQRMLKIYNDLQSSDKSNVVIRPFVFNMQAALSVADLAVFRAGAVGLAELTTVGIPAILIPYPYAAENHQEYNARALEKQKAAVVILDRELSSETLLESIGTLTADKQLLDRMAAASKAAGVADAADSIAAIAIECVR